MRRAAACVALLALALSSACHHRTTLLPGVLDLRTDASGAPVNPAPFPPSRDTRSGGEAIMFGDGVQGTAEVTIEDRTYWVFSLFPAANTSATEEFNAALANGGGMRSVTIGERYGLLDWAIWAGVVIIPMANIFSAAMPPRDFVASGTRIRVPAAVATAPAAPVAPTPARVPDVDAVPAPVPAPGSPSSPPADTAVPAPLPAPAPSTGGSP